MKIWKKLPELIAKDALARTIDVFEKARIRIAVNISVVILVMLVPLDVALISTELYLSFAVSMFVKFGMILCIYFTRTNKVRTGSAIATLCVFLGITLDILFSETIALVDILWFALLIMFAFFTLGSVWGSVISVASIIASMIYVIFFFYSNFHDESIYVPGQVVSMGITIVFGFLLVYVILKEVRDAQEDAENKLKSNLVNLISLNEQLNRLNIELKASNKNLESFSHSVSHDLRSPLRSITSYTELLLRDTGVNTSPKAVEMLGSVKQGTDKMRKLISDLLTFSLSGTKDLSLKNVNMNDLLKSVIAEYETNEGKITAELVIHSLPDINADEGLMSQVWYNLFANAVKYSSRNEKPVIEISATISPQEVIYSVKDNGVGFDMKYADRLFRIFQRLHSDDEFKGTGIGLAIVKQIVTRHGGRVWAEGKPGEGAVFYFALPGTG